MSRFRYVSGIGAEAVELDGVTLLSGNGQEVRSYAWGYDVDGNATRNHRRTASESKFEFYAFGLDELIRLCDMADRDMQAEMPGTFVIDGKYSQRGYITGLDLGGASRSDAYGHISAILLDGFWWSIDSLLYDTRNIPISGGIDYPFDYAHDYAYTQSGVDSFTVSGLMPADIKLQIFGPAFSPQVKIGGNTYAVNVNVPAGRSVVIDGKSKSILLTSSIDEGEVFENLYSAGVRGSGEGSGSYVFQKLEPGEHEVVWDGSFSFNLGAYTQTSVPSLRG